MLRNTTGHIKPQRICEPCWPPTNRTMERVMTDSHTLKADLKQAYELLVNQSYTAHARACSEAIAYIGMLEHRLWLMQQGEGDG